MASKNGRDSCDAHSDIQGENQVIIHCVSDGPKFKDRGFVRKGEIKDWYDSLPDDAILSPVMWDYGSQRDPDTRMIGLIAKWTETR